MVSSNTEVSADRPLNADQHAVVRRQFIDMIFGLRTLLETLDAERFVPAELGSAVLSNAEYQLADISRQLGIPLETAERVEERGAALRQAHRRIQELETTLGQRLDATQVALAQQALAKQLERWWELEGFGHIRSLAFDKYGNAVVEFSCHLFGDFSLTHSPTPVTDAERKASWLADLQARGFVLHEEHRGSEFSLIDCDANRTVLTGLLKSRLPSLQVNAYENHVNSRGVAVLRSVRTHIFRLQDIAALNVSGNEEGEL